MSEGSSVSNKGAWKVKVIKWLKLIGVIGSASAALGGAVGFTVNAYWNKDQVASLRTQLDVSKKEGSEKQANIDQMQTTIDDLKSKNAQLTLLGGKAKELQDSLTSCQSSLSAVIQTRDGVKYITGLMEDDAKLSKQIEVVADNPDIFTQQEQGVVQDWKERRQFLEKQIMDAQQRLHYTGASDCSPSSGPPEIHTYSENQ